jgi:hypothetical protein
MTDPANEVQTKETITKKMGAPLTGLRTPSVSLGV